MFGMLGCLMHLQQQNINMCKYDLVDNFSDNTIQETDRNNLSI